MKSVITHSAPGCQSTIEAFCTKEMRVLFWTKMLCKDFKVFREIKENGVLKDSLGIVALKGLKEIKENVDLKELLVLSSSPHKLSLAACVSV